MNYKIQNSVLQNPLIIGIMISIFIQFGCKEASTSYKNTDELVGAVKTEIRELPVDQFIKDYQQAGKEYTLIDVRQAGEFDEDNIPGSVNIPRGILEFKVADEQFWQDQFMYAPADTSEIIVYCKKGSRGALATKSLIELGYKNVKNLEGGFLAYAEKQPKKEDE